MVEGCLTRIAISSLNKIPAVTWLKDGIDVSNIVVRIRLNEDPSLKQTEVKVMLDSNQLQQPP